MKTWTWFILPALFLGGLMIGRWNPAPPAGPVDAQRRSSMDTPRSSSAIGPVTGMLRIPDRIDPSVRRETTEPETPPSDVEDADEPDERESRGRRPEWADEMEGRSLQERIEWAADAWRLRTDIARDTFLADAGLTREDATQFDVLMHAMNLRLEDAIAAWAEDIQAQESVRPEDGVRLLHQLSEALVVTYDEMDRTLPPVWREVGGERFDLMTFVDPSVAMPLVNIEDRIEETSRTRRPRRGRPNGSISVNVEADR